MEFGTSSIPDRCLCLQVPLTLDQRCSDEPRPDCSMYRRKSRGGWEEGISPRSTFWKYPQLTFTFSHSNYLLPQGPIISPPFFTHISPLLVQCPLNVIPASGKELKHFQTDLYLLTSFLSHKKVLTFRDVINSDPQIPNMTRFISDQNDWTNGEVVGNT